MLALTTPHDAVHLMKIAWLQTMMKVQMLATAVLTATCLVIVAVILSTYAQQVSENMQYPNNALLSLYNNKLLSFKSS